MSKKIYKVTGMHCASCATSIEWDLEDQGVVAKCDYVKQQLEVEIESGDKEDVVKQVVEKLGYKIQA